MNSKQPDSVSNGQREAVASVEETKTQAIAQNETVTSAEEIELADQTKIEAAVFRRLLAHLDERKDVQNIDMMILAGFCRNCLSRWYQEAANERGIDMSKDEGREAFYGMPFSEWKATYQTEASREVKAAFEASHAKD